MNFRTLSMYNMYHTKFKHFLKSLHRVVTITIHYIHVQVLHLLLSKAPDCRLFPVPPHGSTYETMRLWPHVCDDSDSILTWLRVTEPFSLPDISLHWNIYRYCCEGLTEVVIQVSGDDERARAQLWEKTKTHPLLAHRHNVLWRREGCSANSISIIMRIYFCLIIMYLTLIWYCNVIFFLWQEVANRGLVMYLLYVHFEEFHRNVLHNEFIEQAVYRGCHSPWTMLCCIF